MDRLLALCMSYLFLCWVALALVMVSVFWRLDIIEQYFGVSPDNGDGSIEALSVLVVCIMIVALALRILFARAGGREGHKPPPARAVRPRGTPTNRP
jgi:hypothetical protein